MTTETKNKYFEAVGRRKTAVAASARACDQTTFTLNEKDLAGYFPTATLQAIALDAFTKSKLDQKFTVWDIFTAAVRILKPKLSATALLEHFSNTTKKCERN